MGHIYPSRQHLRVASLQTRSPIYYFLVELSRYQIMHAQEADTAFLKSEESQSSDNNPLSKCFRPVDLVLYQPLERNPS
jgi:hypothetical protein